jgi:urease accessory protein
VHPPGGVVGGDELRIDVLVDPGAHALITTPAATKFYRCDGRISSQTQELRAAGATFEWLPQENIFYRGADTRTATRVHVDADSRFIGWEINCLGLPARGEHFDVGALRLDLELWRSPPLNDPAPMKPDPFCLEKGAAPIFLDRVRLSGEDVESIRELVAHEPLAAVSLVDGVLVLRALAPQAEAVRNLFISAWQRLRPRIIGRDAVLPRIWAT